MDNPLPTTLAHGETVSEETNDSTNSERDPKDDGVVLTQPPVKGPISPLDLSASDSPLVFSAPNAQNLDAQDTPDSSSQKPTSQDAPNI